MKKAGHWYKIKDPETNDLGKHICVYGNDHYIWAINDQNELQYRSEMKYDNHETH